MKEILPEIIENIRKSYFAKDEKTVKKVIKYVESLVENDKLTVLGIIGRKPRTKDLDEWNLEAVAWRTIERSMEYPYKVGDKIKFGSSPRHKTRTIISIDAEAHKVEIENGDILPMCSIRFADEEERFEQMELF
ncbi:MULTISPECIES: hypothetical protein [Peribacillus]|uniref:hypothetical protein n=1 Tax=Peribacillus TaxID=2675229 RepID=UPI000BA5EBBC|nr:MULTISPECIES: hypothetical protein [Peribacillus]MBD8591637.1 hypothetical protein [Peribacillus simplex]MCM3170363.1 hypothetical protein [Peribacillus frigoritolerans]MEE3955795.1 hypothetical protein [Peribacillus frigoritolerans]PAL14723.1 hypothetical protein B8W99_04675 [Peribacillus simplex]